MKTHPFPIALPLGLLVAAPATAQPFQNIDALEARVIGALGAGIGEPGGPAAPIDRRLKLQQCPGTVQIDPPVMGAVALRCQAANWRIRVALTRLGGAPGGAMASGGGLGGQRGTEALVRRGDPVDLVAESDSFSVSVAGVAQEDGALGSRIRIKADGRSAPVFAEVIDSGRARLPGFK